VQVRQDKVIYLISITVTGKDAEGLPVEAQAYRKVFASKRSVYSQEFYQAAAAQLRPSVVFEVFTREYADEEYLMYESREYKIIRTFGKNEEKLELICSLMPCGA
jgi:SPP1 family predicted phage head-tail adaptor